MCLTIKKIEYISCQTDMVCNKEGDKMVEFHRLAPPEVRGDKAPLLKQQPWCCACTAQLFLSSAPCPAPDPLHVLELTPPDRGL